MSIALRPSFRRIPATGALALVALTVGLQAQRTPIPEDLLYDDHVREELGVNAITVPSIERIFKDLEELGNLPYEELSRKLPEKAPRERSITAISLGTLITDGLLTVQCEERGPLKPIGEALRAHAEALGADKRVTRHAKSLVEHSLAGDWKELKKELTATQHDVEAELVLLRDARLAILISLGGWLRASQIASVTLKKDFDAEKATKVMRLDVIDYFNAELESLALDELSNEKLEGLRTDLIKLREQMTPAGPGQLYTEGQLAAVAREVDAILSRVLVAR